MSIRLNLGCGENRLEGWQNTDAELDVTKPLPFNDDSVDEILVEHVLEHCTGPDIFRFLLESKRTLRPGGVLHISMPVLDRLEPDHARDIILGHGHLCAWTRDSIAAVCLLAEFSDMTEDRDANGLRPAIYGHYRAIGEAKDEQESFRIRLIK